MESNSAGLNFALLDVNFVTAENNGDVLADTLEVAMPVRHVLVGDARRHVKHDDATLALDVIPVAQTTKLLLASRVPYVENEGAEVGGEAQRVHLNTECGCGRRQALLRSRANRKDDLPMYFFSNSPVKWR